MGINLGAFIAPLVCGYLGQQVSWHAGFAAAGFGMLIGVIQYVLGGTVPRRRRPASGAGGVAGGARRRLRRRAIDLGRSSWWPRSSRSASAPTPARSPITPKQVADGAGYGLLIVTRGVLRLAVSRAGTGRREERKHLYAIGVLFLAAALFWSLFEQAGSTLNLFADRDTRTTFLGWGYPEQLVPVGQLAVRLDVRAGVRVAVAPARPRGRSRRARSSSRSG